jgi:hypothetical protein
MRPRLTRATSHRQRFVEQLDLDPLKHVDSPARLPQQLHLSRGQLVRAHDRTPQPATRRAERPRRQRITHSRHHPKKTARASRGEKLVGWWSLRPVDPICDLCASAAVTPCLISSALGCIHQSARHCER